VADDNAMVRESLRYGFQGTEVEVVVEAATGREATSAACEHDADVALLDIEMPDGTGLQALEWIRSQLPDLPVLMYSMHISRDHACRSRELGAAGYLIKGCPLETLLQAIRAVVDGRDAWHLGPEFARPALERTTQK
jgi:DNA-binding NarL/FixJ family response regulator